jgi:hypothetical protein
MHHEKNFDGCYDYYVGRSIFLHSGESPEQHYRNMEDGFG